VKSKLDLFWRWFVVRIPVNWTSRSLFRRKGIIRANEPAGPQNFGQTQVRIRYQFNAPKHRNVRQSAGAQVQYVSGRKLLTNVGGVGIVEVAVSGIARSEGSRIVRGEKGGSNLEVPVQVLLILASSDTAAR